MKKLMVLIVGVVFLGMVGIAGAFTQDLYETVDNTPTGTPTDNGPVITLPSSVGSGFVVLLDNTNGNSNQNNWSDVLIFTSTTVQLLSDVNGAPNSLWPSFATVTGTANAFILEIGNGLPTVYSPSPNTYNIFSSEETRQTPEPASMLLLGSGLVAMAGFGKKRFFTR